MAGAGVGDEVEISWRGGGWGGGSAPPQQRTKSKGEQLALACLFGFFSAKQTNGKAKAKRERRTAANENEINR